MAGYPDGMDGFGIRSTRQFIAVHSEKNPPNPSKNYRKTHRNLCSCHVHLNGTNFECFGGNLGWLLDEEEASCVFPLTQFERNFSVAVQICGAINHSTAYRVTNWLTAKKLLTKIDRKTQGKIFWTGLKVVDLEVLGVESEDAGQNENEEDGNAGISNFTSIYNPLWAKGEPKKVGDLGGGGGNQQQKITVSKIVEKNCECKPESRAKLRKLLRTRQFLIAPE
ncbi:unnamed protein product [Caenorhabditis angaria]|uniref:Uncharacterized protein n=1 Tax=Caenorhabditis angaria TaxID=860376 RepID=A0A9P1I644_9PELO|nr:unnamed protein product [Caenorhabditis angaria]